ncbi:MAG: hypothetical protein Q7L07_17330 [Pseudohongiella sp.]|nr:hypothetical protein [Pseudohongiella sp.]MDP2284883.1 hypothetical protein [Pseudohongiella sp.]
MNFMSKKWSGAATLMPCLLASVLTSTSAAADSVLYKDNQLTISDAIVMEAGKTSYYRQVRLEALPNGDFRVVEAVEKQLAYVEELSVAVLFTDPVEVEVGIVGYMSNPCVEMNTTVARRDNTFFVAVGETPLQTLVACAQVIVPFNLTLPLDVKGLPAGDYRVVVNGDDIDFTLD